MTSNGDEHEMQEWLESGDPTKARHARLRLARAEADGFFAAPVLAKPSTVFLTPLGKAVAARPPKPRMSFDQLARAKQDCVPCQAAEAARAVPPALTAAVVVPCHNYGHWLAEALESVLGQSRKAVDVLVVDDASADDTQAVAESFAARGARYLRTEARSVWEARKAGFLATNADVLCFLDADDILPSDYLERGLPLFGERTGFVYSDYENFGDAGGRSNYPEFDRGLLDCENYAHAGSLVRRRALEVSQAFDRPKPTEAFADWYLWRRLTDAGFTAAKSPALYRYRRHAGSMIVGSKAAGTTYHGRASLALLDVTIVCPLSGRDWAWPRYRDWLEAQTWPRSQCRLLVLDTGPTRGVREWLSSCDYPDVRYVRLDVGREGLADLDRVANVYEVRLAMSRIYRAAAAAVETPFAFIVEDDVVPPDDAVGRLMRGFDEKVCAVSGAYQSRYHPGPVAWTSWAPNRIETVRGGQGVQDVGGIGFGCLLVRRCVLAGETFALLPGESADYDVNFFERLRAKGWTVRLDWDTKADHRSAPP